MRGFAKFALQIGGTILIVFLAFGADAATLFALLLGSSFVGAVVSSGNLHDWLVIGGVSLVSVTASFATIVGLTTMGGLWFVMPLLVLGLIPVYLSARMGGLGVAALAFAPWGVGVAAAAGYLNTLTISMDLAWKIGLVGLLIVFTS